MSDGSSRSLVPLLCCAATMKGKLGAMGEQVIDSVGKMGIQNVASTLGGMAGGMMGGNVGR